MSAALLDELLADYVGHGRNAHAAPTPAKAAKAANRQRPCGLARGPEVCEALRISANGAASQVAAGQDSQNFAAVRKPLSSPQSEETRGSSQDSQDSQGCPLTCTTAALLDLSAVAWTDADIARFADRRARLLRWGWTEAEAEKLAERLATRDREHDERVSCGDCQHYRPGRCGNHRRAGLNVADVGRELAAMLQRCPGFQPVR